MIKKHGFSCKKRIFYWGYDLLPVWLRVGLIITKAGVRKQTSKHPGCYD